MVLSSLRKSDPELFADYYSDDEKVDYKKGPSIIEKSYKFR
jgi:hypothetical protein